MFSNAYLPTARNLVVRWWIGLLLPLSGCLGGLTTLVNPEDALAVAPLVVDGASERPDYFAYGDSLVAAFPGLSGNLSADGMSTFIVQMRDQFDSNATVAFNRDGSGMGSLWARTYLDEHLPTDLQGQTVVMSFGNNDPRPNRGGLGPQESADSQARLYDEIQSRGARVLWANLVTVDPECGGGQGFDFDISWPIQRLRVEAVHAAALHADVMEVPFYDALDSRPFNGRLDFFDSSSRMDCGHPTREGQGRLAELVWMYVSGAIQESSIGEGGRLMTLRVPYNHTVVALLPETWNTHEVIVVDAASCSRVESWPGAGQSRQFEGVAGETYLLFPAGADTSQSLLPFTFGFGDKCPSFADPEPTKTP